MKIREPFSVVDIADKVFKDEYEGIEVDVIYQPEAITGAAGYSQELENGSWIIGLNEKMPHTRVRETVLMELAHIIRAQDTDKVEHLYDEKWQQIYKQIKEKYEGTMEG